MSYDYQALVDRIARARATAYQSTTNDSETVHDTDALQEALQALETLSSHCPMTPLLWLQYAYDMGQLVSSTGTASASARIPVLELGLHEFPGSAVLHVQYVELLLQPPTEHPAIRVQTALSAALDQVGRGSHRTKADEALVVQLYRLQAHYLATQTHYDQLDSCWLQRARVPLQQANDGLGQEVQEFYCNRGISPQHPPPSQHSIEQARKWQAKTFHPGFISLDEDIEAAMAQEGIQVPPPVEAFLGNNSPTTDFMTLTPEFTNHVLQGNSQTPSPTRCWMGLGGAATANACIQYATALRKLIIAPTDNQQQQQQEFHFQHRFIMSVYERGIAECPTVEAMWLAYIKHITWIVKQKQHGNDHRFYTTALSQVTARAVRNCPYSLALVQHQLNAHLLLSTSSSFSSNNTPTIVFDPDQLMAMCGQAMQRKFLNQPTQWYELYLTVIRIVHRRILSLLAEQYYYYSNGGDSNEPSTPRLQFDDPEPLPGHEEDQKKRRNKKKKAAPTLAAATCHLDDDAQRDLVDLCDDLTDIYETAETQLKSHSEDCRALLQREWAASLEWLILPIQAALTREQEDDQPDETATTPILDPVMEHYDQMIRLTHAPRHPDLYLTYIRHVQYRYGSIYTNNKLPSNTAAALVLARIRHTRWLFHLAMTAVGKPKQPSQHHHSAGTTMRDYETALAELTHEYLEWERRFGSETSLGNSTHAVQKKWQQTNAAATRLHPQQRHGGDHCEIPAPTIAPQPTGTTSGKRKAEDTVNRPADHSPQLKHVPKRQRANDQESVAVIHSSNVSVSQEKPLQQIHKKSLPKIKVGSIYHKAHPFTVRVSNLSLETHEMDLVQVFRNDQKCGAIVHAKIVREKQLPGKAKKGLAGVSKGWGLIQFEERDGVDKALALHDKIDLRGQSVHIERSHVPAVGVVPFAMIRPKQSLSAEEHQVEAKQNDTDAEKPADSAATSKNVPEPKKSMTTVLSFRPRGVGGKSSHPKKRLG